MTKVVINTCFGGFGLSDGAFDRYLTAKGVEFEKTPSKWVFRKSESDYWERGHAGEDDHYITQYRYRDNKEFRTDPDLIKIIEELGEDANGSCAELKIVEIPDDVEWQIEEYDGMEWVAEKHRTWD